MTKTGIYSGVKQEDVLMLIPTASEKYLISCYPLRSVRDTLLIGNNGVPVMNCIPGQESEFVRQPLPQPVLQKIDAGEQK